MECFCDWKRHLQAFFLSKIIYIHLKAKYQIPSYLSIVKFTDGLQSSGQLPLIGYWADPSPQLIITRPMAIRIFIANQFNWNFEAKLSCYFEFIGENRFQTVINRATEINWQPVIVWHQMQTARLQVQWKATREFQALITLLSFLLNRMGTSFVLARSMHSSGHCIGLAQQELSLASHMLDIAICWRCRSKLKKEVVRLWWLEDLLLLPPAPSGS